MPEAKVSQVRHVFVYGTLRRGEDNDITRLLPPPRFVGLAQILGTMYDLGTYPGVRLGGRSTVLGEVYEITPALEAVLDEIEEVYPQERDEYVKRVIPVSVQGRVLSCMVYEIGLRYVHGKAVLPDGDWTRRSPAL